MSSKEKKDAADEAKGVSEGFIQSLGLVELIVGGVGLYWLRLWYQDQAPALFPSTGLSYVDAGLLAFAAALVGKLLSLSVAFLMAVVRVAAKALGRFYYPEVETSVYAYMGVADAAALEAKLGRKDVDLVELGSYYLVHADATQRAHFELIRTRAIVAYSAALLALPYFCYFVRQGAPASLTVACAVGVPLLLVLGLMEQLDYLKSLAERLTVVRTAPPREGGS
jgi:hypothetical protein